MGDVVAGEHVSSGRAVPVIRLQGDDSAIRAVGREAAQVVGAAGTSSAAFFAGLVALHRDRARFLAATATAVGGAGRGGPLGSQLRCAWTRRR